jgi:hypothetical protein
MAKMKDVKAARGRYKRVFATPEDVCALVRPFLLRCSLVLAHDADCGAWAEALRNCPVADDEDAARGVAAWRKELEDHGLRFVRRMDKKVRATLDSLYCAAMHAQVKLMQPEIAAEDVALFLPDMFPPTPATETDEGDAEEKQKASLNAFVADHILFGVFGADVDEFIAWGKKNRSHPMGARLLAQAIKLEKRLADHPRTLDVVWLWVQATRDLLALGWAI